MAILIKMKSGARHFGAGQRAPRLMDVWFSSWWNPFCWSGWWFPQDFLGGHLQLKLAEVESLVFCEDSEVNKLLKDLQASASRLARP